MRELTTAPRVSVVIPIRDEGASICELLSEAIEVFTESELYDFEIVVVDDGSRDDGVASVRRQFAEFRRVRVVSHTSALGQSAAIATGAQAARGEWICILDGDGQNDPRDVVKFTLHLDTLTCSEVPVLLAGWRTRRHDTMGRRVYTYAFNNVSAALLGHPPIDCGCGIKMFRRTDFLSLPRFDHMHRFLGPLFASIGAQVVSLPVNHRPRMAGRSHYRILTRYRESVFDMLGVFWLLRRLR